MFLSVAIIFLFCIASQRLPSNPNLTPNQCSVNRYTGQFGTCLGSPCVRYSDSYTALSRGGSVRTEKHGVAHHARRVALPGINGWNFVHRMVRHFCALDEHARTGFRVLSHGDSSGSAAADMAIRSRRGARKSENLAGHRRWEIFFRARSRVF